MLDGKVAIVTGGASGLGEATCRLMVAEGARVVVADIQDERGAAVAADLGDAAVYAHLDVTSEDETAQVIDDCVARWGGLDVMFNNAGIVGAVGPIDEMPLDEWQFSIDVLLKSVFLGSKHAARIMKPQGRGVILATSSVAGVQGGLGPHPYNMAKTAVVGFTKNLAAELAPFGVRANAIAPGKINTPMNADVIYGDPDATDRAEALFETQLTPLRGRGGRPYDIAQRRRLVGVGARRLRDRPDPGRRRWSHRRRQGGGRARRRPVRDAPAPAPRGRQARRRLTAAVDDGARPQSVSG